MDAVDACYGALSHAVWRTGEVNGWAEGTYTVTYSLTDPGGNIVLMHDGRNQHNRPDELIKILPAFLRRLSDRGLRAELLPA